MNLLLFVYTVAAGWVTAVQDRPGVPLKIAGRLENGALPEGPPRTFRGLPGKFSGLFVQKPRPEPCPKTLRKAARKAH